MNHFLERNRDPQQVTHCITEFLPSAKAVNNFKNKKALSQEVAAAKIHINKKPTTKVTLHFYATKRNRTNDYWPCLILNFYDDDRTEGKNFFPSSVLCF